MKEISSVNSLYHPKQVKGRNKQKTHVLNRYLSEYSESIAEPKEFSSNGNHLAWAACLFFNGLILQQ